MMRAGQKTLRLPWVGRTFDLKAAYKQFGVNEEDTRRLKIALKAGPDAVRFFDVLALPFGATGSVVAFLRVAASLAFIGTNGLYICWSSFFDDFTAVSPMSLSDNTQFYVEALFRLFGIDFASEGDKAPPFDQVFKSLGLQFDLNKVAEGYFTLGHTDSRRRELLEQIETMIEGRDTLVSSKEPWTSCLVQCLRLRSYPESSSRRDFKVFSLSFNYGKSSGDLERCPHSPPG